VKELEKDLKPLKRLMNRDISRKRAENLNNRPIEKKIYVIIKSFEF